MIRVLIYEKEESLATTMHSLLEAKGYWVVWAKDQAEALELFKKQNFHLCVWDVSCDEELAALYTLPTLRPYSGIIVASHNSDPLFIVRCVRAGASHFWKKHAELEQFVAIIEETAARIVPAACELEEIDFPLRDFIGRHPGILEIFDLILSIKNSDSNVLITGESGTGKEVVARAIHSLSSRKRCPWVAINCGAIPSSLLESELFGHVKGAFTGATQNRMGRFQMAGSGTLFLDEIGDLPTDLQAKLLRAIQHRVYEPVGSVHSQQLEARVIAATNQDLERAVINKTFREDLFYRLNVIPVYIPPLRSRKSDIPLLAKSFLDRFCERNHKTIPGISEEAMRCLMGYHWPGNIRELENLIERVVVLKKNNGIIELKDFPIDYFRNVRLDRFVSNVALPEEGLDLNEAVNDFENELILQALQRTSGNKNQAAHLLNLNRTTLVEKLKRKGLRIIS